MNRPADTVAAAVRRVRIVVRGRVQGVGFRPTLYRELTARGCGGAIRNTPEGVVLEVEGAGETVRQVVESFRTLIPSRARVDELVVEEAEPLGQTEFTIAESSSDGTSLLPIPPDLATCAECVDELRAPGRRSHHSQPGADTRRDIHFRKELSAEKVIKREVTTQERIVPSTEE